MIDCKKSIVHHDALEILIEALNSNGMSLEKHMVENSIFICPDKVKKQMEELESLLKTHQTEPHDYLVAGNSKLPVRYSSDKTNVIYKPGTGITDCKTGYAISMSNDIYTEIHSGAAPSSVVWPSTGYVVDYKNIPIVIDRDNNYFVRAALSQYTGHIVSQGASNTLINYTISHIWPYTADPFYFTSLWNIVLIPAHCNYIMDKGASTHPVVRGIQELFRAICYLLYDPNSYLTTFENILKKSNPNIQIPRVAVPSQAAIDQAQIYINNGLIFI